jgi:hypothetical protein
MGAHAKNYQTLTNSQGQLNLSVEENVRRFEEERRKAKEAADAADSEVAAMREMQQAMKTLGLQLFTALKPLLPLVTEIIKFVGQKLPEVGEKIKWFIENLFSEDGRSRILSKIGDSLAELISTIAQKLGETVLDQSTGNTGLQNNLNAINKFLPTYWAMRALGMEANTVNPAARPQQQSPAVQQIPTGRSAGSWGTVGSAFENFGSGTSIVAHGTEGVFTPSQINQLMAAGTGNNLKELISQLNNTQAELVYQMRQVAENSRRNVQATESLSGNAFA